MESGIFIFIINQKNNNFLHCDWVKKKLLFSTDSLAKLLLDCVLLDSLLLDSSISQSHLNFYFKSTNQPTIYASFVSLLIQIFPFSHNWAVLLFSKFVIFMINWYQNFVSSNSGYNYTRDKQIGLSLRGRPILLILVSLQTELDSTQYCYHYLLNDKYEKKNSFLLLFCRSASDASTS